MSHDQAYLEAEKKIEEALKSGATELDLRRMKLITNQSWSSIKAIKQIRKITVKTKGGSHAA